MSYFSVKFLILTLLSPLFLALYKLYFQLSFLACKVCFCLMIAVAYHLSISSFMNSQLILIHLQVLIIHLMEKIVIFILGLLYHKVPGSQGKAIIPSSIEVSYIGSD